MKNRPLPREDNMLYALQFGDSHEWEQTRFFTTEGKAYKAMLGMLSPIWYGVCTNDEILETIPQLEGLTVPQLDGPSETIQFYSGVSRDNLTFLGTHALSAYPRQSYVNFCRIFKVEPEA